MRDPLLSTDPERVAPRTQTNLALLLAKAPADGSVTP